MAAHVEDDGKMQAAEAFGVHSLASDEIRCVTKDEMQ